MCVDTNMCTRVRRRLQELARRSRDRGFTARSHGHVMFVCLFVCLFNSVVTTRSYSVPVIQASQKKLDVRVT
jgi:hypothetical protein